MEVLVIYFFEIEYRLRKKMGYTDYLSRINQINTKYFWNKKDVKFILNILYNKKKVYRLERYKNPLEGLIQVLCEKIDLEEISYQMIYREIRKEIGLYIVLIYIITDKGFNCDFYIIDMRERIPQ